MWQSTANEMCVNTLGRTVKLGMLYNGITDNFVYERQDMAYKKYKMADRITNIL